jgi:hypothetical protein
MVPSDVNNALREMMSQIKNQQAGLDGDSFTVDGSLILNGATSGATTFLPIDAATATITLPGATGTLATLAGSETLTNKALNGTLGATTPSTVVATTVTATGLISGATNYTGFKNRIIGGDFGINPWQRGTTIAVAAAGNLYTADRFKSYNNTDGAYSVIKTADAPTVANAGSNTEYCLDVDVTTADATIAVGQICQGIIQKIEGYNVASFGFGKAGTRYVTLSFWVKSTKTGIFYVSFTNAASNRSYPAQYTVSVTNTWENKVITVPVDTSGTWDYTTGEGLNLVWVLASNAASTGTANTWGANVSVPNDQVNALDSTSNNFKLALIQLELGSTTTSFDYRPYGTELALCQRYYYKQQAAGTSNIWGGGFNNSTTVAVLNTAFPVEMRISPTALEQSGTATQYQVYASGGNVVCSAVPAFNFGNIWGGCYTFTVASGLTAGQSSLARSNSASAYLGWSAEL